MGETSAKKMRGGGMDDVIFNGTNSRPARNIAEVLLHLDNADRNAPAQFNDKPEIEILRRIERDSGSSYRINGQEVRARDVQRLFADLATGAHATALVGQGEIGKVINSKPIERRTLLEEAAGISGLQSRRHEAELRLQAAETNLERLDDIMQTVDTQYRGLKRQARQANRYRNLSGHIRKANAQILFLKLRAAKEEENEALGRLQEIENSVKQLTQTVARQSASEIEKSEALAPLRINESECAAKIHRLILEQERLNEEEQQASALKQQLQVRLKQITSDFSREEQHALDAIARLDSLALERSEIESLRTAQVEKLSDAEERAASAEKVLATRELALDRATQELAKEEAQLERLTATSAELENRQLTALERLVILKTEQEDLLSQGDTALTSAYASRDIDALRLAAEQIRVDADNAEKKRSENQIKASDARDSLQLAEADLGRVRAESDALSDLLSVDKNGFWPPLIDAVVVEPGLEAALGAALGDDLAASSDAGAPSHWHELSPTLKAASLPPGAIPLSNYVTAPSVLSQRLAHIGLVEDQVEGDRLRDLLRPGQRLVTRDGALWRWDGYTVRSDALTAATTRLNQRNRLTALDAQSSEHAIKVKAAQRIFTIAKNSEAEAAEADTLARIRLHNALEELRNREKQEALVIEERARREYRLSSIEDLIVGLKGDVTTWEEQSKAIQKELSMISDINFSRETLEGLREELVTLRQQATDARGARQRLENEAIVRSERLAAIIKEELYWEERRNSATKQIEQLTARKTEALNALHEVSEKPAGVEERRIKLLDLMEKAEANRKIAADDLTQAESILSECITVLRETQSSLASTREVRVRIEGQVLQVEQVKADLVRTIAEVLEATPEEVADIGEISNDKDLPDLASVEGRIARLKRERETMGPVNLRADMEANELAEQLNKMEGERADLSAAIARLRDGISSLNQEGRERILTAFKQVNLHFSRLFKQLFAGGESELKLVDSDDPLEAGIEILASPPGKRLQIMSLLSGGEQALTALSLLFAVFLTHPAPVCVLDEVDAPLDDSNVERFLDMVGEIVGGTDTKFLIITHNPISMSRMDRLFGVTMPEYGVSQLVSVNLAQAEQI